MQPKTKTAAVGYGSVTLGTKEQTKRFSTSKKKMPLAWALIPIFAAVILFFIVFKTNDASKSWEEHKEEFSLVFPKETDGLHKQCYEENLKKIAALNAKQDATFEAGEFAHLCGSHFLHCGARKREGAKMENGLGAQEESDFKVEWFDPEKHFFANERLNEFGELSSSDIPDEFDWTDYVNPPIKDQGNYGSCWTFAAAEGIEMARWIEGKGYERVSTQQLLDCLNVIQTPGKQEFCFRGHCGYLGNSSTMNGGWAEDAYRYWHYTGYVKAKDYPYQWSICKQRELLNSKLERTIENVKANCLASDYCGWNDTEWLNASPENFFYHLAPQYCQNIHPIQTSCRAEEKEDWGKTKGIVLVSWNSTYFNSPGINEEIMKEALYRMGPLTVDMNAVPYLHYKSGILDYSEEECSPNDLDHVLQLVGYGTENGVDYWKIRNSWSPWFGENGYVRFKRGKNICGIAESVSRPMI